MNLDCQLQLRTPSASAFTSCAICKKSGSPSCRRRSTCAQSGRCPILCWTSCSFESPTWRTFRPMQLSSWLISVRWYPPRCPSCSSLHRQRYLNRIFSVFISLKYWFRLLYRTLRIRQDRLARWCTTSTYGRGSRSCSVCLVPAWRISRIAGLPDGALSAPTSLPMKSNKWSAPCSRTPITAPPSWPESNNCPIVHSTSI